MAKNEDLFIELMESMKKVKAVTDCDSTDIVEISNEFIKQREKFLAWKQSRKFPAVIRLGIDRKANDRILYTPQTMNPYYLPDIELGSVIKFWECEKNGKRNFLLYEFQLKDFESNEIVAEITDFFAIGLNIFRESETKCKIKVCDGTPDDVKHQVKVNGGMNEQSSTATGTSSMKMAASANGTYPKMTPADETRVKMAISLVVIAKVRSALRKHHSFAAFALIFFLILGGVINDGRGGTGGAHAQIQPKGEDVSLPVTVDIKPQPENYVAAQTAPVNEIFPTDPLYVVQVSDDNGRTRAKVNYKNEERRNGLYDKEAKDFLKMIDEMTKNLQAAETQAKLIDDKTSKNSAEPDTLVVAYKQQRIEVLRAQLKKLIADYMAAQLENPQTLPGVSASSTDAASQNPLEISRLNGDVRCGLLEAENCGLNDESARLKNGFRGGWPTTGDER